MTKDNSPYYRAGCADGARDVLLVQLCPPQPPLGLDPDRAWSGMYKDGYRDVFSTAVPHVCTEACKRQQGAA